LEEVECVDSIKEGGWNGFSRFSQLQSSYVGQARVEIATTTGVFGV